MSLASLRDGLTLAICPSVSGGGGIVPDLSGYNNHGILQNMSSSNYRASQFGLVADFDYTTGTTRQAIEIPNNATVSGFDQATLSVWCFLQSAPANNAALYYESTAASGFTKLAIFQLTTNQVLFIARDTETGSSFSVTATVAVDTWIHLCGCYDANTDRMELFANAVSVGTNLTAKGVLHSSTPASPIAIGAFTQNSPTAQFSCNSLIDDVRLYKRIPTQGELQILSREPGIGLRPERTSVFFGAQLFNAAWARNSNTIISPVGAA